MDSASFSICAQFLSDCRSAREANSDALSRAFVCNDNDDDCEQRPRIMNVNAFDNFPDARLLEVKNATEKDAIYLRPVSFGLS
jgi:hypothetical protein